MKLMIKHKVIGLSILAALLPVLVIILLTFYQRGHVDEQVVKELDVLARENTAQISKDVWGMLNASNDMLLKNLDGNLKVARKLLNEMGTARLTSNRVTIQTVNQFTKSSGTIQIPKMYLGRVEVEVNKDFNIPSPVVDEVESLVGGTCTIFQKMNNQGDMLRIATNVRKLDNTRAVGTYIPAVNPDGTPNAVVSTVLSGQTYKGRAYVVNAWYLTVYEPLRDSSGRIIGMLYAGIKQENVNSLRQAVMKIVVGKTGYVYILGGKENHKGHYIVSKDGVRDGEDIFDAKDADGRLFIQDIIKKALVLKDGEVDFDRYPWKNEGDKVARYKIAAVSYFEPWDWVIGAGTYEDDYYEAKEQVGGAINNLIMWSVIGGIIFLVIITFVSLVIGTKIAKPIEIMTGVAEKLAKGNINQEVEHRADDETGRLAHSFREMIEAQKEKAYVAEQISNGNLSLDIKIASEEDVLGKSMQVMKNSINAMSEDSNKIIEAAIVGNLNVRADVSKHKGDYKKVLDGFNIALDTIVGHLDNIPAPIMIIDREFNVRYLNPAGANTANFTQEQTIGMKCFDIFKSSHCKTEMCALAKCMKSASIEKCETDAHPNGLDVEISYTGVPIKNQSGETIGALDVVIDQTEIKNAQKKMEKVASYQSEEVVKLSETFDKMSKGDLTISYSPNNSDEDTAEVYEAFSGVSKAIKSSLKSLNELLGQVSNGVDQVASGSEQVSDSSQSLSQGAAEQASSLEEISSSVTELTSQTKQNAENASQANQLSTQAKENASGGSQQMASMLEAMNEINESSEQINKIIKVIDEIAFQTNLLALNAAVEAARAGVHGKGFAVVADEVRNLAQRSAEAAKETTELIEETVKRVENGTNIANETAKALEEIVNQVTKATDLVGEIASASNEQAQGINQISEGFGQVDQVTQSNTAIAEESASASEELSSQAANLKQMLLNFKLTGNGSEVAIKTKRTEQIEKNAKGKSTAVSDDVEGNGKTKTPAEVIALDDEEFGNY